MNSLLNIFTDKEKRFDLNVIEHLSKIRLGYQLRKPYARE